MDWSYIAGYFDGEGHVSLHKQARGGKTYGLCWYNTHHDSLVAMQAFMQAGNILKQQKTNRKIPIYTLTISRKADIIRVLEKLIPLLLIKREQAKALLQYVIENVDDTRMVNFGAVAAISDEQLIQWYHTEGKSYTVIATMLNVNSSAVAQSFKLRGITAREAGGSHMKGKPKSEETKRRMKESRRKMWKDPEFRASQLENLSKGRKAKKKD